MKRLAGLIALVAPLAHAQCVMCFRTAAAQNLARGRVMDIGIFIMGIPPFLILAGFLLLCWRRNLCYADRDDSRAPVPEPDVEPVSVSAELEEVSR